MQRSRLLLQQLFIVGLFVCIASTLESLRSSAVVLQSKTNTLEPKAEQNGNDTLTNATSSAGNPTKPQLTGIPQIDYISDPNLPRELNGYNLTNYPFYNAVPEEIDFKCDGLHDGFYASVLHKCQLYHHCLFGTRYDFLCANYTAFDQKTFICQFVSEVDCVNSPKYYSRNEALYKEASTTISLPPTTSTTTSPSTTSPSQTHQMDGSRHGGNFGRRHRPYRRRRPVYEYYYDDDEEYEDYYYNDEVPVLDIIKTKSTNRKQTNAKENTQNVSGVQNSELPNKTRKEQIKPVIKPSSTVAGSVYNKPRTMPKIRRPVPKSERDKYDYVPKASYASTISSLPERNTKTSTSQPIDGEYYDDEEEYEYDEPKIVKPKYSKAYNFPAAVEVPPRHMRRQKGGHYGGQKRIEIYDDYEVGEGSQNYRYKNRYPKRFRGRPMYRNWNRHEDYWPRYKHRRRPSYPRYEDDEYYYDDEEDEILPPRQNSNLDKKTVKPKSTTIVQKEEQQQVIQESSTEPVEYTTTVVPEALIKKGIKKENNATTTEGYSTMAYTPKHKTVKIGSHLNTEVLEVMRSDQDQVTESAFIQTGLSSMEPKLITESDLIGPSNDLKNKNLTRIGHIIITAARKPNHILLFSNTSNNSSDEKDKIMELDKPMHHQVEPLSTDQGYQLSMGNKFHTPVKPTEEPFIDNLNAISPISFNAAFISGVKGFEAGYSQDNFNYGSGVASVPETVSGLSATTEEQSSKKYLVDLPNYTLNNDYDVTYNDALQPSTLYSIRQYPSTSFHLQNEPR